MARGSRGLGPYDPRTLFNLNVGDEVGYELTAPWLATIPCHQGQRLRRIVARQQTADSLLLRYQEQDLVTTGSAPGCMGAPGTAYGRIRLGRWAFSLGTGASPQWPFLGLLAGEYRPAPGIANAWLTGQGYDVQPTPSCLDDGAALRFVRVYGTATTGPYRPGLDYLALNQSFGPTLQVGAIYFTDYYANQLVYYRRGSIVCEQPLRFGGLLATRAALASSAATLVPNPAATAAVLTLVAAAQPGTVLVLSDAPPLMAAPGGSRPNQSARAASRPAGRAVPSAAAGPGRYPPRLEATQAMSSQVPRNGLLNGSVRASLPSG